MSIQIQKTTINRTIHPTTEEFTINTELFETIYNLVLTAHNREITLTVRTMDTDTMAIEAEITTHVVAGYYDNYPRQKDISVYKAQLNRTGDQ